jgi:hypothetical protein
MKAGLVAKCVIAMWAATACADPLVPTWVNDPGATRDVFTFPTGANPAIRDPGLSLNPYGDSDASITVGDFGEGWYDPSWPITLNRDGETGVWDIGSIGTIVVTVPVAAIDVTSPGTYNLYVEVIGYVGMTQMSILSVDTQVKSPVVPDVLDQADPPFGGWYQRVWEFEHQVTSGRHATLTFVGDYNGSSIDRISIYTIPEPSTLTLGLFLIGGVLWRNRLRRM